MLLSYEMNIERTNCWLEVVSLLELCIMVSFIYSFASLPL